MTTLVARAAIVSRSDFAQWLRKTPRGWTMMAHEKRGKPVCRYFATGRRLGASHDQH